VPPMRPIGSSKSVSSAAGRPRRGLIASGG
jgi:hypothetical protein